MDCEIETKVKSSDGTERILVFPRHQKHNEKTYCVLVVDHEEIYGRHGESCAWPGILSPLACGCIESDAATKTRVELAERKSNAF